MFPWESAASGDEETPSFVMSGPLQIHISADIAIAAWNYYRVMQDEQWLREKGYALIKETADFWVSRVEREGPGRYDIRGVVAADEYAQNVDNDAYTNAAARANLAAATAAAKILGLTADPDWEHVRQNIPIHKFADGTTREHATYHGARIKQADVNLLAYPLQEITDPRAIQRDLDYYAARVDHLTGPAMTKSILAVLYQRLGKPQQAYEMFQEGYKPNKRTPFGVLAEHAQGENPYFVTAAGGLLQALLYGFGGLDITNDGLTHTPTRLPRAWKSLTLTGIGPQRRTIVVSRAQ
jgi:trehalose/maltose hydrolase-like predicted phosphorylase